MTITEHINYLSKVALNFNFNEYLITHNKEIIIFEIDTINNRYVSKEGLNFEEILEQANRRYFHSKAGYLVDVKTQIQTQVEADLLLISDIVLNSNPIDIDTIIIHELVHMLIDSDQSALLDISENAREIGNQIYKLTDYPNETATRHTTDFCQSLAQACITYNNMTKNFMDGTMAIRSALRFDIFE